jgi:hypothetical protein
VVRRSSLSLAYYAATGACQHIGAPHNSMHTAHMQPHFLLFGYHLGTIGPFIAASLFNSGMFS